MKLIGLQIENLRKIKAFNMEFDSSGLIQIRGKNEQGKSTLLDAVEILFRGKKHTPSDVITHGEKKARIIGQFNGYKIERIIDKKDHKIKISNEEGKQVTTSPQSFLDAMINELTFDPKPFVDKTSDQKFKFMIDLSNLDFSEIDEKLKNKETERTFVGREVKDFGDLPILAEVKPVDVTALMQEKELANKKNNDIERGKEKVNQLNGSINETNVKIKKLEDELALAKMDLSNTKKELETVTTALDGLGDPVDTTDLDEKINTASETNAKALAYDQNQEKKSKKAEKELQYETLTDEIKNLRVEKQTMLKNAPMPVEGLEIREDGVFFDGIHCDNWSDSQSIKISFQLCVAMKPELEAIFIDRGESYDPEQLELLKVWAKENDIQAFITIVDGGTPGDVEDAIYIEDGSIIAL